MTGNTYTLYGWQLSYFSGKTRAYLNYKGIPYVDKAVDAYTLMKRIPAKTGATVMPVVVTPQGEWLQDTTHIVEVLEARFPAKPVVPTTPRQRIAAGLIEAWADEWWIPTAMHYRWSYPENYPLFRHEAGRSLLPWAPALLRNRLADYTASKLRGYLSDVGVVPEQFAQMENWTVAMLDALELHFRQHDYLFGGAPTIADFALVGPLYGHLGRDPAPLRELVQPRPALQAWIHRVHDGLPATGTLLADDALPDTLAPVWDSICGEFLPMVMAIRHATQEALATLPPERPRLPRALGRIEFPMAGERFSRNAIPYILWMLQRVQNDYRALPAAGQTAVRGWLQAQAVADALDADLGPALVRKGLHVALAAQHDGKQAA